MAVVALGVAAVESLCFGWMAAPKLRPVQGWYEEKRLVAPEGGAPLRGPHPPKPPAFQMEGRLLEPQGEEEQVGTELLDSFEVGTKLHYLSLARTTDSKALSVGNVPGLVEFACREAQRGALQAEDLGSTLRAIATYWDEAPAVKSYVGTVSDCLLGRATDLQATGTTDALAAVAGLSNEAPMVQALLPVLIFRLAKTAPQLTTEEAISNLFSTTILRRQLRVLKLDVSPLTIFLSNKLSQESMEGLPIQVLTDLLWTLAFTRTLPNDLMEALAEPLVAELLHRDPKELRAHNTYSMLYSVAMLQETCVHARVRELLPLLSESLEMTAQHMTPSQISGCLWSLGWIDPKGTDTRGALEKIREEIGVALGELKMKELSIALWGMAALQFRDEDLLHIAAERFIAWHPRVRAHILAKHISRICWAFAKLEFRHKMFTVALIDRLQPHNFVIRFLQPDQLHALLWSINWMMKKKPEPGIETEGRYQKTWGGPAQLMNPEKEWSLEKTKINLEAKVMAFIKMRYRHGKAPKIDEFGKERIHKVTIGRLEPYVEISDKTPVPKRNAVMLEKAIASGEVGPDVPNIRRKSSGRPKWSVTRWVDGDKRFTALTQRERMKELKAASMKQLEAGQRDLDGQDEVGLLREKSETPV